MSKDLEEEVMVNAISVLHDLDIEGLDPQVIYNRIVGITEAYTKFVDKQLEDVEGVNAELPLTLAMGLSILNIIPIRLGYMQSTEQFTQQVKDAVMRCVSEDFDTCIKFGYREKSNTMN